MEKFILATVVVALLTAASVSAQKGRSIVNANRSPARKAQAAIKSPLAQAPIISQMPIDIIRESALSANSRNRPQPAPSTPLPRRPSGAAVAAPTPIRPATIPASTAAVAAPARGYEEDPHPAPEPYSFSFAVNDEESGAQLTREESQDANGNIVGFYHILDAEGRRRRVDYTAGPDGFKATINSNEEGLINRNSADADFVVEEAPIERQNAAAAAAQAATRSQNGHNKY